MVQLLTLVIQTVYPMSNQPFARSSPSPLDTAMALVTARTLNQQHIDHLVHMTCKIINRIFISSFLPYEKYTKHQY